MSQEVGIPSLAVTPWRMSLKFWLGRALDGDVPDVGVDGHKFAPLQQKHSKIMLKCLDVKMFR